MLRFAFAWLVVIVLSLPAHAQFSGGGSGGGTFTGPFPGNPIDPTILYGAGVGIGGTATTATTTNGSNSITVASASNWVAGRGINVNNLGASGTYTQVGCVGSITGLVFTIVVCGTTTPVNAPSSQTGMDVFVDDLYPLTLAVNLAASTSRPIQLQGLYFNLSSTLAINDPITLRGAGKGGNAFHGTGIFYYGLTGDIISVSKNATLSDFWLIGAASNGYALNIENTGGGACANIKPNIQRIGTYFTHAGIRVGLGVTNSVIRDIYVFEPVSDGLYYAAQVPCGDNIIENIVLAGCPTLIATGCGDFIIYASDTTTFNTIKLGGARMYFIHEAFRTKFLNLALEDGNVACAIDFGSAYISGIVYTVGEIYTFTNAFCNTQQALSSTATNIIGYSNGTSCIGGKCSGGTGIMNYIWPPPIFSGCGTNGAVQGTSDLLNGIVAMTCSNAPMTITYNAGPNSVPNNGLLCEVQDITDPTKLFRQTGYSITNNGTMTSAAYATFASVSTLGSDILKYHCQGF